MFGGRLTFQILILALFRQVGIVLRTLLAIQLLPSTGCTGSLRPLNSQLGHPLAAFPVPFPQTVSRTVVRIRRFSRARVPRELTLSGSRAMEDTLCIIRRSVSR